MDIQVWYTEKRELIVKDRNGFRREASFFLLTSG